MAGEHWCRVVANRAIDAFVRRIDVSRADALEISGTRLQKFPFRFFFGTQYPDFDVCRHVATSTSGKLPEKFDLIFMDQVLEHVDDPLQALRNVRDMLKDNGVAVVATPFLIRIHGSPGDHWRWSETGLRRLLRSAGFADQRIETYSWGNKACVVANLDEWVEYEPEKHSLENEPDYPCVVWAYAQKS